MLSSELAICRLCMSSDLLINLYSMDGNVSLYTKTSFCIDVKIHPGDGLPSLICKRCEKTINNFYEYKQRCTEVDFKLRTILQRSPSKEDTNSLDTDIKSESGKNTYNSWLTKENEICLGNTNVFNIEPEKKYHLDINIKSQNKKQADARKYKLELNQTKSELQVNNRNNSNIFQCEICGHILKKKAILNKHLMSHSGIKQFSCNLCPKRFTRVEHKIVHIRSHMGIKPFICEICGKASRKRQDLVRHMRVHSEEKKYVCPHCERRFKRSSDVSSHMRTHTGARPYTCNTCEKSYSSHSGLQKHYKTHCKRESSHIK